MSDSARKPIGDQLEQKLKPDSQKSTTEHMGNKMSGTADSAAGAFQPSSEKSTTQKATDSFKGNKNEATGDKGIMDKAKDAVNSMTGNK